MRHTALRPLIWLSLFTLAAAGCEDSEDSSTDNPSTEEGGSGGRTSATSGRSGSAGSTAGRAGAGTATSGRGGSTASGGTGATSGAVSAGRGGSSSAGRGGTSGATNAGSGGAATAAGAGGTAGQTAAAIGDAEIVAVLTAVNNGEVQLNNVAVTKAVAPVARSYAQDLVNAHTASQTRLNGVITAASITPKDSAVSTDLTQTASQLVSKLQAQNLDTFDTTYIQSQIDVHRQVLEIIDEQLLPNVKGDAVRAEIRATRAEVVEHLNRARAIGETLDLGVDAGTEADAGL